MSAPDEQAHVIKAASVVRGQLQGESGGAQGEKARVDVPLFIAATDALPACFASKPAVSAACSPQLPSDATIVPALTSAGNYNPLYYAMAGVPSLFLSGAEAVYAMRIVGALLASAFLALALISLAGLRQWRISVFVGFIALTPMVLFLAGAVNPNALEIATAMAVFCGLCLSWERIQQNNSWKLPLVGAALSATILVNTRAGAMLWLALAVVASLILYGWRSATTVLRTRFGWAVSSFVLMGCLLSWLWLSSADSFESLVGQGLDSTPVEVAGFMLYKTFYFAIGYVSYLGWLDTPGPTGVLAIWTVLMVVSIVVALLVTNRRGRLAVGSLTAALLLLPPILQIPLAPEVGIIWQGRYILALVVVLIAACGVAMRSWAISRAGHGKTVSAIVLASMVFGHFYSFIYGLRRYVVGLQDGTGWWEMFSNPQWQPPFGWAVLAGVYLSVLIVGAVLVYRWVHSGLPTDQGRAAVTGSTAPAARLEGS